jgi:hypothetical protein
MNDHEWATAPCRGEEHGSEISPGAFDGGRQENRGQPHGPKGGDTTEKSSASSTMRGEDPCGCAVPAPCDPGAEPLPSPRWAKSGRTARKQKRKLQNGRLDGRRCRGTEVAEITRSVVRQESGTRVTRNPAKTPTPTADRPARQRPVRVKLTRPDAYVSATYPPDGETENWWRRLNEALGTMSSDFVNASLLQLQAAARSPFGTISETAMNAALAMITAAAPRDEIEAALAIQMACTHTAAMSILSKLDSGLATERRITAFGSAAARLMKTYAMQVEVFRRLRHGGHQYVRVEHVHMNGGGQAVIGNIKNKR